jgi:hypothetical protein
VACDRIKGFAEHMVKGGVKPIIITRNWNENQTTLTDMVMYNEYKHEAYESHEIHRMPYRQTLRDKLATKKSLHLVQRFLTLKEILLSHFFIRSLPYSNLYDKADELISSDPEIEAVIVSGTPFLSFQIGYKLKKKHPNILWIPDYRDEWTTHPFFKKKKGLLNRFLNKLASHTEKKWLTNSSLFITTSKEAIERIQKVTGRTGTLILNGFDRLKEKTVRSNSNEESHVLKIAYYGTVYDYQNFVPLFSALENLQGESILYFIGTEVQEDQKKRLQKETESLENIKFIDRMGKPDLYRFIEDVDVLALTSYDSISDWYPAKLFDYYSTGKMILLISSDNGVMSEFIEKTNCGLICSNKQDCTSIILEMITKKKLGKSLTPNIDRRFGDFFSRENQSIKLSEEILKKWNETNSLE